MRKLKPILELNALSNPEREQLLTDLENGLTFDRAVCVLGKEHFIAIGRTKLFKWYHREQDRRDLNTNLPPEHQLTAALQLDLLNGLALPWPDLMHARIFKSAYLLTCRDDNTAGQLLCLQRLANNPFSQQITREKLNLEKRRQNLREQKARTKKESSNRFHLMNPEECDKSARMFQAMFREPDPADLPPAGGDSPQMTNNQFSIPNNQSSPENLRAFAPSRATSDLWIDRTPESQNQKSEIINHESPPSFLRSSAPSTNSANSVSLPPSLSLEETCNEYALARYHEANHLKDPAQVGSWHALNFKTQLYSCPCGNHVPCPQHGDFTERFWEVSSDQPDYIDEILAKKLPYTAPHLLIRERKEKEEREQHLQSQPKSAICIGESGSDSEAARIAHAERRCAAYLPLRPGETSNTHETNRDNTWIDECPCGAKFHCYEHPGLLSKVRYLKPWDPDYAAALQLHDIPLHLSPAAVEYLAARQKAEKTKPTTT